MYNIYTIQIHHNNSYQNYMRLERNIHEHERPSTKTSSKTKVRS